ncbi:hypothetical protein BIW11_08482 [Tropilaelaps mercedesae]|uniref:Uncharacterized protein n=1 Tax=Tropilaelaps mercedesae TaxID=418985 RepID=A0A1V9XPC6_9ACAR|nr:hypothetical protein BIW11_08482 [Tropilaelaps mercedesae]
MHDRLRHSVRHNYTRKLAVVTLAIAGAHAVAIGGYGPATLTYGATVGYGTALAAPAYGLGYGDAYAPVAKISAAPVVASSYSTVTKHVTSPVVAKVAAPAYGHAIAAPVYGHPVAAPAYSLGYGSHALTAPVAGLGYGKVY